MTSVGAMPPSGWLARVGLRLFGAAALGSAAAAAPAAPPPVLAAPATAVSSPVAPALGPAVLPDPMRADCPPDDPTRALAEADGTTVCRTLSNGLTVIVRVDQRAPTAVHMVWLRAGAMDEALGRSGAAHVLEHMMFKGTPSVPEGAFSRQVAAWGGRENAFTTHTATAYHQQVPVARLGDVMRLEADRLAHVAWSDLAFDRERAVVQEERRLRTDDSPVARLGELLRATAWLAAPARRPVIGWPGELAALRSADVRDFYRRWYQPANAAVVVVGDVQPRAVLALARTHYGPLVRAAVPERAPWAEPEPAGERRVNLRARAEQSQVLLAYPVPLLRAQALRHPTLSGDDRDALALNLLADVLDGYPGARLDRALRQGAEPVADAVSAHTGLLGRAPSLFVLSATPASGRRAAQAESALLDQLALVVRDGVSPAELIRVQTLWRAAEVYKRDSVMGLAQELGQLWVAQAPLDADARLMAAVQDLRPADLQAAAARWLRPDALTVATLTPLPACAAADVGAAAGSVGRGCAPEVARPAPVQSGQAFGSGRSH